jgi:sugar phosphate isomerase/epimerase
MSDADIRLLVSAAGLRVNCLDPFTRWLPQWDPPDHLTPQELAFLGTEEADFFRIAEAVEARSMTVFEPFGVNWPIEVLAASLAAVCERAESCGLRVNIEFIPFLGIPDLATAWQAVRMSGAPNAGIVLDTWHFFRGNPDHALLATIPGARIGAVQVSDGRREPVGTPEDRLPASPPSGGRRRVSTGAGPGDPAVERRHERRGTRDLLRRIRRTARRDQRARGRARSPDLGSA